MTKSLISKVLISAALIAATAGFTSGVAMAREGATSVGNGIKCYTAAVTQPNGTVTFQRVCYKGV